MPKGYYLNKNGYFVIDKQYLGQRIFTTTRYREGEKREVEALIREEMNSIYNAKKRGDRPCVTFRQCAVEYCLRNSHQNQIEHFTGMLDRLDMYIGSVVASELHQEHPAFKHVIADLKKKRRKNTTINSYIEAVSRVLTAAVSWRYDWCQLTWLESAPKFDKLEDDSRPPKPISWKQQDKFFPQLPPHLRGEAIVFVNTGLRDTELNTMRWKNELVLPGNIMGFIVNAKGSKRKKHRQRLVVFNDLAKAEVDRRRGDHNEFVFTYKGKPKARSNNNGFQRARERANLDVRVQDLRHTFGHRLRAAGVDKETRSDLLGHGKSLTTHYSAASIQRLHEAVQKIMVKTAHQVVVNLEDYRKIA